MHSTLVTCAYGDFYVPDANDLISNAVRLYGEWAQNEIHVLSKFINPGDHVVDAGACIGTHTRAFSQMVDEEGKVYAFEPNPLAMELLCKNIDISCYRNIEVFNLALGQRSASGVGMIFDSQENIGACRLNSDSNINSTIVVNVTSLDDVELSRVDFIKADLEGGEYQMILGAEKTIRKNNPIIFIEVNDLHASFEILKHAKSIRYKAFGVISSAFNHDNFNKESRNIFGKSSEVGVLLIPIEKMEKLQHLLLSLSLPVIETLDSLAYLLLHKPQYYHDVLQKTSVHKLLGSCHVASRTEMTSELEVFFSEGVNGLPQPYNCSYAVAQKYALDFGNTNIDLMFPRDVQSLTGIRLDIANAPAAITLYTLALHHADSTEIWHWDGCFELFVNQADMVCLPDDQGVMFLSLSDDPRCELALSQEVLAQIHGGCFLRLELTASPLLDVLPGVLSRLQAKSEAALPASMRPQLPARTSGHLAELGELLKTVVERKNATIAAQMAELQVMQDRQNLLYEQLVRAEAQLDLLKQLVLPEATSRLERL